MTEDKLFEIITKIIASPHSTILEHDKVRAVKVFLALDDYLIDYLPGYCEDNHTVNFGVYANKILDELEENLK